MTTLAIYQDVHTQLFPFLTSFDFTIQKLFAQQIQIDRLDIQRLLYMLLGVARAVHSPANFTYFFEWLYPENFKAIQQLLKLLPNDPESHIALIKFLKQLTTNYNNRLRLDNLNGFIIFKECCPIVTDLLQIHANIVNNYIAQGVYQEKAAFCFKLLTNIIEIILNAMTGNYILFGVLEVYNDTSFIIVSRLLLQRILSINADELSKYKKAEAKVFQFVQELLKKHSEITLVNSDTKTLVLLLNLIKVGLCSENSEVITCCCSGFDDFVGFIVKERYKIKRKMQLQQVISDFLGASAEILQQIAEMLLKIACYEEGEYIYQLSHPLFSIIMLNKDLFAGAKEHLIANERLEETRLHIREELQKLIEEVEINIEAENKDKFMSKFAKFRNNIRSIL